MTAHWLKHRHLLLLSIISAAIGTSLIVDLWVESSVAVLLIMQFSIVATVFLGHTRLTYVVAVAEALCFNLLFTQPRYSFQMFHAEDIANLCVFIITAFSINTLAQRYQNKQNELKQVQLRNQILLSVSHDLRTPLAGIIGNLTTLKEYFSQLSENERFELLESATTESHRLHQYIENLLQATKLQHGNLVIRKNQESIIHILKNTIHRFPEGGRKIHVNISGDIATVNVSHSLIEQALFNILDNALRYSPPNIPVNVSISQQEETISIDIFNQGEPISESEKNRIFDLFYSRQQGKNADGGIGLGLPDGDGIDVLNNVRASSKTPILILTARDQEDEKIRLLEAGANDYLSKPFGVRELIARIKVLVRDLVNTDTLSDILEYNRLKINKSTHQAWMDGKEVSLTKKEFAFIEKLMAPPGRLVKQSELLTTIWGQSHENDTHYLRILVSQLRKKLHDSADEQNIIKTESGVGYRLV